MLENMRKDSGSQRCRCWCTLYKTLRTSLEDELPDLGPKESNHHQVSDAIRAARHEIVRSRFPEEGASPSWYVSLPA